jgi:hypothetical protein
MSPNPPLPSKYNNRFTFNLLASLLVPQNDDNSWNYKFRFDIVLNNILLNLFFMLFFHNYGYKLLRSPYNKNNTLEIDMAWRPLIFYASSEQLVLRENQKQNVVNRGRIRRNFILNEINELVNTTWSNFQPFKHELISLADNPETEKTPPILEDIEEYKARLEYLLRVICREESVVRDSITPSPKEIIPVQITETAENLKQERKNLGEIRKVSNNIIGIEDKKMTKWEIEAEKRRKERAERKRKRVEQEAEMRKEGIFAPVKLPEQEKKNVPTKHDDSGNYDMKPVPKQTVPVRTKDDDSEDDESEDDESEDDESDDDESDDEKEKKRKELREIAMM